MRLEIKHIGKETSPKTKRLKSIRRYFFPGLLGLLLASCTQTPDLPEAHFQGNWPGSLWIGDSLWGTVQTGETPWKQFKLDAKHQAGQGLIPDSTAMGFVFSKQGALYISPFGSFEGTFTAGLTFSSPLAPGTYRMILTALNMAGRTGSDTIFIQLRYPEDTIPATSSWIQAPPNVVNASDSLAFSLLVNDVNAFGAKAPIRWLRFRVKTNNQTRFQQDVPWPNDTIVRKFPLTSLEGEGRLWWLLQDMYGNQTADSLNFTIQP